MEDKILYRYKRADGGTTVSLDEPSVDYTILHRLIAAEGMLLTDGKITTPCKDVESIDGWTEIEDISIENELLEKIGLLGGYDIKYKE